MPTIAWFYGIAIRMYVLDHAPPQFHAVHGEHQAFVSIDTGEVVEGALPKAAARLVKEWALAGQEQLREKLGSRPGGRAARKDRRSRC